MPINQIEKIIKYSFLSIFFSYKVSIRLCFVLKGYLLVLVAPPFLLKGCEENIKEKLT